MPEGTGQVRHMPDLYKAKQRVSRYATGYNPKTRKSSDKFDCDWTIYLWNAEKGKYEVLYEGRHGMAKKLHPLFQTPLKKGAQHEPLDTPGFEDEVESALQSIREAIK